MSALRSNSFHFVPRRDVPRAPDASCPLVSDEPARQVARPELALWLRLRDRMRLFETDTADFEPREVERVRRVSGQLYLDVSRKVAHDDFARDLRKVTDAKECLECAVRGDCAGRVVPLGDDVFTRDDARVLELLANLTGTVLDVGAGEAPYYAELAPRASRGELRYLALEPDAERARLLLRRIPSAVRLDSLQELTEVLDHALLLRSYNHLTDAGALLEQVVARLRPGGTLLLVDNETYGVIRSAAAARAAERGPARFEHAHNAGAAEVAAQLARFPLSLLDRRDVSPHTSNQWLLHYRRDST